MMISASDCLRAWREPAQSSQQAEEAGRYRTMMTTGVKPSPSSVAVTGAGRAATLPATGQPIMPESRQTIPAKAGNQLSSRAGGCLGPSLRWDDSRRW